MATPLVAANWKMNTTISEAEALVTAMKDDLATIQGVQVVLCPPFISLAAVRHLVEGTPIHVGAQNLHWEEAGAFTGEVSPAMLAGLCDFAIAGHSERRNLFGEDDEMVNRKVLAAVTAGIWPILCVGETLEEREQGRVEEVVTRQLRHAIEGVRFSGGGFALSEEMGGDSPGSRILSTMEMKMAVAYEPVWAIGTGRAADGQTAQEMMGLIRNLLATRYGRAAALRVPLLYGGSVNSDNIEEFVAQKDVDGTLVGGASLHADQFVAIVRKTAEVKAREG